MSAAGAGDRRTWTPPGQAPPGSTGTRGRPAGSVAGVIRAAHRFLQELTQGTPREGRDLHSVLRQTAARSGPLLGAQHCLLWYAGRDESGGDVQVCTIDGREVVPASARWRDVPAVEEALRTGVAVHSTGTPLLAADDGARSVLTVPLLPAADTGRVHGALVYTHAEAGRFGVDEAELAMTFALTASVALDNTLLLAGERAARRLAEERERTAADSVARAELLQSITTLLQTSATTADISGRVPRAVRQALDCLSAAIYVRDGDLLVGAGHPVLSPEMQAAVGTVEVEGDNPMSQAFRTGKPLLVTVADSDTYADLAGLDPGPLTATLVVPLFDREQHTLGVLAVNWSGEPSAAIDVDLFAGVAAQIAVALERAQLLDAERAGREELARSVSALSALSRELQRGLLPQRLPELDRLSIATRYQPAVAGVEIGGDWYDVIENGREVVFVIGDVQGHNTRAAALMGRLSTAVRAYLSEGHTPSAALERTNSLLLDLGENRFATCCLLRLDLDSGAVVVASAGHPPPVVVDGRGLRLLDVDPGPPLGVLEGATFPGSGHRLRGRSSVVLHTDGVVETPESGSDVGDATLREVLARHHTDTADDLATAIMDAIPHRLADDAAMLVLTYAGANTDLEEQWMTLPRDVRAVGDARSFLREMAAAWSVESLLDEAELLLSEIVTNALVHTEGGASLGLRLDATTRTLTISVQDSSTRHPTERHADDEALGGRGLGIVEVLAADWGVEVDGGGKTVWASLIAP